MYPSEENIKCKKGDVTKLFSANQLALIGKSADGTYDGWLPMSKKPVGIPDAVVLSPDPNATPDDPNGGQVVHIGSQAEELAADPNYVPPVADETAPVDAVPVAPAADPDKKVEKVDKTKAN